MSHGNCGHQVSRTVSQYALDAGTGCGTGTMISAWKTKPTMVSFEMVLEGYHQNKFTPNPVWALTRCLARRSIQTWPGSFHLKFRCLKYLQ